MFDAVNRRTGGFSFDRSSGATKGDFCRGAMILNLERAPAMT
jgi:hypothetical protein